MANSKLRQKKMLPPDAQDLKRENHLTGIEINNVNTPKIAGMNIIPTKNASVTPVKQGLNQPKRTACTQQKSKIALLKYNTDFLQATAHLEDGTKIAIENCLLITYYPQKACNLKRDTRELYRQIKQAHKICDNLADRTYRDSVGCLVFNDVSGSRGQSYKLEIARQTPDHAHMVLFYETNDDCERAQAYIEEYAKEETIKIHIQRGNSEHKDISDLLSYCGKVGLNEESGQNYLPYVLPYRGLRDKQRDNIDKVAAARTQGNNPLGKSVVLGSSSVVAAGRSGKAGRAV